MIVDMKCEFCGEEVIYKADNAAPGKRQSWICSNAVCSEGYWVYGGNAYHWDDVNPEDVQLTIADVI